MEFVIVTIVCVLLAVAVVWRVDEAEKTQEDGQTRFSYNYSLPLKIAHSSANQQLVLAPARAAR